MTYEDFSKALEDLGLSKKEFANAANISYIGVTNWRSIKGETPKWVDSWLENYAKAKKYDFLIGLVAEHIGVKELMVLKDKDKGGKK